MTLHFVLQLAKRSNASILQCAGDLTGTFNGQPAVVAFPTATANLLASTTAVALIQYSQYTCMCPGGQGTAPHTGTLPQ